MSDLLCQFAKCNTESVTYMRGEVVKNTPVNLALCKSIRKSKFAWYPDNTGLPSIVFEGCDVEWAYDDLALRDLDYEKLCDNRA